MPTGFVCGSGCSNGVFGRFAVDEGDGDHRFICKKLQISGRILQILRDVALPRFHQNGIPAIQNAIRWALRPTPRVSPHRRGTRWYGFCIGTGVMFKRWFKPETNNRLPCLLSYQSLEDGRVQEVRASGTLTPADYRECGPQAGTLIKRHGEQNSLFCRHLFHGRSLRVLWYYLKIDAYHFGDFRPIAVGGENLGSLNVAKRRARVNTNCN